VNSLIADPCTNQGWVPISHGAQRPTRDALVTGFDYNAISCSVLLPLRHNDSGANECHRDLLRRITGR